MRRGKAKKGDTELALSANKFPKLIRTLHNAERLTAIAIHLHGFEPPQSLFAISNPGVVFKVPPSIFYSGGGGVFVRETAWQVVSYTRGENQTTSMWIP